MGHTVVCVVGTRPEVVKMAPVVLRLRSTGARPDVRLVTTGQHRELLDQALADFGLTSDDDLDVMRPAQPLAELTARLMTALAEALDRHRPDLVLAQGDTTSVLCAALASYYRQVPFGHVEAGLRTGLPYAPFPEEKNRTLASHLATLHFAPTPAARENLLREGIAPGSVFVTGNTVVDALLMTARQAGPLPVRPPTDRFLLMTAHRREHFGAPLEQICRGVLDVLERAPDLSVVFPVHPNPQVRQTVARWLGRHERIRLIEPVGYRPFVALMKRAFAILTDSGGVQEEAPSLGKPVVLLRHATERPEAVAAGCVRVAGPDRQRIAAAIMELYEQPDVYERFTRVQNPYGDGWAAERIARAVAQWFGHDPGPPPEGMPQEFSP